MLTKEALSEAYELGVQQALINAGLIKEAGKPIKRLWDTASKLLSKSTHGTVPDAVAISKPNLAATQFASGLANRATGLEPILGSGGASGSSSLRGLIPQRLRMAGASIGRTGRSRIYPHEAKSLLRMENRLVPTSPAAMPIRPAFGMANRLPPSRLPG